MARGDTHREPIHAFADAETGRRVLRLTDPATHCHHCYFYHHPFTPDSRRLVYVSDRTGRRNLFLLDLQTGDSVQLTDAYRLVDYHFEVSADGRELTYAEENQIRRLDLERLTERTLYVQEYPWHRRSVYPGFSHDLSQALLCQTHAEDMVPAGAGGWDSFPRQFEAKPRCRLVLVDLLKGTERVVLEERLWLGHPQIRPHAPDTLMYCHEGPWDRVDCRMWLIQADGTHKRPVGYWEPHPGVGAGVRVGHEYFTPDGRYIAFAYFPAEHGQQGSLRLREVDTLAETDLGHYSNYNHFMSSPDGSLVAGDECGRGSRQLIWLYQLATRTEKPLCRHGSSCASRVNRDTGAHSTQDAHPHPLFSPDSRTVVFSSDMDTGRDGNCSVYAADAIALFAP